MAIEFALEFQPKYHASMTPEEDMKKAVRRVQSLGSHVNVLGYFARKVPDGTIRFEPVLL